ncbi:MAG: 50S ribosomal protein L33 [Thiotrichales bacterium]|nr:MAG: 50S ribosomal protein L33 [Thiotrichales bacterium]
MAKGSITLVKLESTAGTGYFYVMKKNKTNIKEKMSFRKYDPRVRKHVLFVEKKLK